MRLSSGWLKILVLLPVPVILTVILVLLSTNPTVVFEPPYLLPVLNLLFLSILPFIIAALAWKGYNSSGSISLFFTGCGMIAYGLGSLIAGFTIDLPGGTNFTPAIHNTGALLAAVLLATASITSLSKPSPHKSPVHGKLYLTAGYLAVIISLLVFSVAELAGLVPGFFVQGSGPTALRQVVLGTATALFAISAVIFLRIYFRSRSAFTYCFSVALMLITVGLCALFLQKSIGSLIGWTGRIAQYLGGIYLALGIISLNRQADKKGRTAQDELVDSFNYITTNFETIPQIAPNALVSCNKNFAIVSWNSAAEKIFGYREDEVIGDNLQKVIFPGGFALFVTDDLEELVQSKAYRFHPVTKFNTVCRRKSGETFPVEISIAVRRLHREWLGTFIIEDISVRKQVEEQLYKEKEFAGSLVDTAQAIILVLDVTGHIVTFNPYMEKVSGYRLDEVRGKDWFSTFLPEGRQYQTKELFLKAINDIQTKGNIDQIVTKAGKVRLIEWYDKTLKDTGGAVVGLLSIGQDITERKKVEDALRESEEKYRKVVDNAGEAILIAQDAIIKFANPKTLDFLAYRPDEMGRVVGRRFTELIHPDDAGLVAERYARRLRGEFVPPLYDFRIVDAKGVTRWLEINALVIEWEGRPATLNFLRDVTARKEAEEAILRSKMLLQNVVDSTPDWMYVKDFQHRYLLVNKSFAAAQNLVPKEMTGRPDTDFFSEELCLGNPDNGISGYHNDDVQAFQGRVVHNARNIISWADGSPHVYDTYKMPLTDPTGKIYAALVYSRDITEQLKAEEERQAAFKALQRTLQAVIDTMARVVEMRDPYTAGHQRRVADLAGAIAREMKLDDSRVEHLVMAAKIHDIGKMYVPSDILSKPGKLSSIEFDLIKTHPQESYNIIKDIEFSQPVALMALQHHERLDGSGYPNRLKGEEMLIESKILAVADVVEAMSSHRPYRPTVGIDKALKEITNNKDSLYDSGAADACIKLFKEKGFKFEHQL